MLRNHTLLVLLVVSFLCSPLRAQTARETAPDVWWEAEQPDETNFPDETWISANALGEQSAALLSGGEWLTNAGPRHGPAARATYTIKAEQSAVYELWVRKFWHHGAFRWRFDGGEWRTCDDEVGLVDSTPLANHVSADWAYLGDVRLASGAHDFELRLLAGRDQELLAGFDCFLLTDRPFVPRGKWRPGVRGGRTIPGWWAVDTGADPLGESLLDLSYLNEDVAGMAGYVRRDGDAFVLGSGDSVRFWGVNVGMDVVRMSPRVVDYIAERLARSGVNLVRIHGSIADEHSNEWGAVDADTVDAVQRFVQSMARAGIYTSLSIYFPLWFEVPDEEEWSGYADLENKHPFGLVFFDRRMQELHRAWLRGLLEAKNPHGGAPLGRNPAIAMIELVNEDSLLFWTFKPGETIPAARMQRLEQLFASWLVERHGSVAGARKSWGSADLAGDAPGDGRMQLMPIWNLTTDGLGQGPQRLRASDQLRFLVAQQRECFTGLRDFLRDTLQNKSLIVCGNWHTADARLLDPLEQYGYTVGDVIDGHAYFGGEHTGEGASYSVREGQHFTDRAGVLEPGALPLRIAQVDGYPTIFSELCWPNPNRFKAELPLLAAATASVQGIDGMVFFALGGAGWLNRPVKFPVAEPSIIAQFPGSALLYRRGDLAQGPVTSHEAFDLDRLFDFEGAANIDPLAFYVGPVLRSFVGGEEQRLDLGVRVDHEQKRVRGQLGWDFGQGVVTIDTPRAQGAVGFLGEAGEIELGDLTIHCTNEFASILVISLDGEPLATSRRVLIQSATEDQAYGWSVEDGVIRRLGGYPFLMRRIEASVEFHEATIWKRSRALDPQGYPGAVRDVARDGGERRVKLDPHSFYMLLD